ncbi:GAF domain-containing protein [Clostridium sp. AN503]|uniref:GAF domain-containing protein n=1 Tax=Clostridium sp. AN503 TaxID=3160598 RepID=UPI0034588F62
MQSVAFEYPHDKAAMYHILKTQLQGLTDGVPHLTANLANASALLNQALEDINWVGFYLLEGERLVLGPFQGKPACIEIPIGKGVCGTAVSEDAVMLIKNVHEFPGHIACDNASNSEIVIPLHNGAGKIVGVLDIDSPHLARFDEADQEGLTDFAQVLEQLF